MMGTTVISNSNSDSEFKQDFQEATRGLLMTVAPSPVRKVVSDSDDDEEKVAVKRLLSFTNQSGEYLHYTDYICGITVLKPLCRWLRLIPSPLLAFQGEPRNKTKLIISWKMKVSTCAQS